MEKICQLNEDTSILLTKYKTKRTRYHENTKYIKIELFPQNSNQSQNASKN